MSSQSLLESCASQQMAGSTPAPSSRLWQMCCEERQVEQEGGEGLELLLLTDSMGSVTSMNKV